MSTKFVETAANSLKQPDCRPNPHGLSTALPEKIAVSRRLRLDRYSTWARQILTAGPAWLKLISGS